MMQVMWRTSIWMKIWLKDVQVAEPELMLEEELVAGDDMMKMEDLPPSGESFYFAGFGRARIYGRSRKDCFISDSDDEEGWLEMATLLHIDVHEDDTKGVGNMSPNVFVCRRICMSI